MPSFSWLVYAAMSVWSHWSDICTPIPAMIIQWFMCSSFVVSIWPQLCLCQWPSWIRLVDHLNCEFVNSIYSHLVVGFLDVRHCSLQSVSSIGTCGTCPEHICAGSNVIRFVNHNQSSSRGGMGLISIGQMNVIGILLFFINFTKIC